MSTKLNGLSISYKEGHLHVRLHMHSKYPLDMTGLPELPADMHDEVVRRIMALSQPSDPHQKIAAGVDPTWISKLARAAIKEAASAGELTVEEPAPGLERLAYRMIDKETDDDDKT